MKVSLRSLLGCVLGLSLLPVVPLSMGCGEGAATDLTIERLPDVSPSLPNVPTLPPPPHPVQHPDQSYSIYGVRRRESVTMGTDVAVTGYIVEIYTPPECPEGRTCPTPAAKAPETDHDLLAQIRDELRRRPLNPV